MNSSVMHLIAFFPALVPVTGSHAAAVVLSQIFYWHHGRLRVKFDGRYYLAKSRAQMCEETGITLDQYKRIMPELAKRGFIVCERHLYQNRITPFIRLTEAGQALMDQLIQPQPPNGSTPPSTNGVESNSNNGTVPKPANLSTDTLTETMTETLQRSGARARAGGQADVPGQMGDGSTEKKEDIRKHPRSQIEQNLISHTVGQSLMNAETILKQFHQPITSGLPTFWQSKRAVVFGGYQKPLTGKEKAQLKQLSIHLGEQARPVIEYVLNHWTAFASRAGVAAGCSFPADPHIGFLLKHHAVAVDLLQPAVIAPPLPVEPPVQSVASGTESSPAHHVSSQELTDLLEGLHSP